MKRSRLFLTVSAAAALLAAVGFGALTGSLEAAPPQAGQPASPTAASVPHQVRVPECREALGANPLGGPCIPRALRNAPPEPGPENDKTLAGIDSNGNGVRDDIERYIAANYGDSPQKVAYLMQYARAARPFIELNMTTPAEAVAYAKKRSVANDCAAALIGPADRSFTSEEMRRLNDFFNAAQDVTLQHLNTPARLAAYTKNEHLLAGQGFTLDNPQPADVVCEFLDLQTRGATQGERK